MRSARTERLRELCAELVVSGLSADGERELATLDPRAPEERASFERAAAALHLALLPRLEPLPGVLRERLRARLMAD